MALKSSQPDFTIRNYDSWGGQVQKRLSIMLASRCLQVQVQYVHTMSWKLRGLAPVEHDSVVHVIDALGRLQTIHDPGSRGGSRATGSTHPSFLSSRSLRSLRT